MQRPLPTGVMAKKNQCHSDEEHSLRESIRIERQNRLENFLDKIEASTPPPHLTRRWTKTLIELYVGHLRAEDPEWPHSKISIGDVLQRAQGIWLHMYVHTPLINRADNIIKKLLAGDNQGALEAAERLKSVEEGKKIASEIQSHNASHKHKKHEFEKLLDKLFKNNPAIGHKEFERELKKHVGQGVIQRIDDSLGEIVLEDRRIFKLSGLKDQIYKRRRFL